MAKPVIENVTGESSRNSSGQLEQLIIETDKAARLNFRNLAAKQAGEAYHLIANMAQRAPLPAEIKDYWGVADERMFFLKILISFLGYASCFNAVAYKQIYQEWKKVEPSNPEPYLRLGFLLACAAGYGKVPISVEAMNLLHHADSIMRNERSAVALALAEGKLNRLELPYDIGRIHLYPDMKNVTTYTLIEQGDWFERDDMDLFRALIRKDDKILDLGANVGVYAVSAALRINSGGVVVTVEPTKATFELLNRSASKFPNMTAIGAAISDKAGTASLLPGDSSELNKLGTEQDQGEQVKVFSVDDIAKRAGIV